MKPIDLDELERLHAAAGTSIQASADYEQVLFHELPALLAELRARRRQVEEARKAIRRHIRCADDECMCGNEPI